MGKKTRIISLLLAIGLTIWVIIRIDNLKIQEAHWNYSKSVNFIGLETTEKFNQQTVTPDANQKFGETDTKRNRVNLSEQKLNNNLAWIDYGPYTRRLVDFKPNNTTDDGQVKFDWLDFGPKTPAQFRTDFSAISDTLHAGDSIYSSLKTHHISDVSIYELNEALKVVFNAQSARPKDTYTLLIDGNHRIVSFEYNPQRSPETTLIVNRKGKSLFAEVHQKELEIIRQFIRVSIKDNLTNALKEVGEREALIDQLTDKIFGSVIDFSRNPRNGDDVTIFVEKKYLDKSFLRYGQILMANYDGKLVKQQAFYYQTDVNQSGYYDQEGRSLARQFLLYPLPFRGITSHFNLRRFHPILKRKVPHLGTDYAASIGTPVYASALGTVTHAGKKGAYGLLVEIKHANGYKTRYAHLSKILVKKGQSVGQQQTIGKVGTTGRSTGPHLHYEIIKNDTHINSTTVNRGQRGKSLSNKTLKQFQNYADSLKNIIRNISESANNTDL